MHDFQQEIDYRYGEGYTVISSEGGVRGTMVVKHDCGHEWVCTPRTINDTKRTSEYFCPKCAKSKPNSKRVQNDKVNAIARWNDKLTLDDNITIIDYNLSDSKSAILVFNCSVCSQTFTYHTKRVPAVVTCRHCRKKLSLVKSSLPEDLSITNSQLVCVNRKNHEFITVRHNSPNCDYAEFTTRLDVFTKSEPRCYICERMQREPVSKPVRDLSNYFDNKGISYRREVSLPDCVNPLTSYPLRFDFEVETPTGLKYIEYDGEQHFMQVEGWESIESTRFRDQIKDCYCARNNIPLLRIPYTELSSMYTIVNNFLTHT